MNAYGITSLLTLEKQARKLPSLLFQSGRGKNHGNQISSKRVDSGYDFNEHRRYQPGDSIARINWAASARSGSVWVKNYQDETAKTVVLILDLSPGMFFGSGSLLKSTVGMESLALLGWQAVNKGYDIHCILAGCQKHFQIKTPPDRQKFCHALYRLITLCNREKNSISGIGNVYLSPGPLAKKIPGPGTVHAGNTHFFIISDFISMSADDRRRIHALHQKWPVTILRILDPWESGKLPRKNIPAGYGKIRKMFPCQASSSRRKIGQTYREHVSGVKKWFTDRRILFLDLHNRQTAFSQLLHIRGEKK